MIEEDLCLKAEIKCMMLYLLERRQKGDLRNKNEIYSEWILNNAENFRNKWNEFHNRK